MKKNVLVVIILISILMMAFAVVAKEAPKPATSGKGQITDTVKLNGVTALSYSDGRTITTAIMPKGSTTASSRVNTPLPAGIKATGMRQKKTKPITLGSGLKVFNLVFNAVNQTDGTSITGKIIRYYDPVTKKITSSLLLIPFTSPDYVPLDKKDASAGCADGEKVCTKGHVFQGYDTFELIVWDDNENYNSQTVDLSVLGYTFPASPPAESWHTISVRMFEAPVGDTYSTLVLVSAQNIATSNWETLSFVFDIDYTTLSITENYGGSLNPQFGPGVFDLSSPLVELYTGIASPSVPIGITAVQYTGLPTDPAVVAASATLDCNTGAITLNGPPLIAPNPIIGADTLYPGPGRASDSNGAHPSLLVEAREYSFGSDSYIFANSYDFTGPVVPGTIQNLFVGNNFPNYYPGISMGDSASLSFAVALDELFNATYSISTLFEYPSMVPEIEWVEQYGTLISDFGGSVATDSSGNAYVAGYSYELGVWIGDALLFKYDVDGNLVWDETFGTAENDQTRDIAVDSSGVYIAGFTKGTLPGQTNAGDQDAFLKKYDFDGVELWTRQFGTSGYEIADGTAIDSSGNVYITGSTAGTFPGQTNAGDKDAFVRKYDSSGTEIWTRQFGTSGQETSYAIGVDSLDNVYVAGNTASTFPGQTSAGDWDAFLRKYDSGGTEIWTRQFGTSGMDFARDMAFDSLDNVYVAGHQIGVDGSVSKYDSNGNSIWETRYDDIDSSTDWFSTIAVDPSRDVVWVGGESQYSGTPFKSDAFIRGYDFDGSLIWSETYDAGDRDWIDELVFSPFGIYATGVTTGAYPGEINQGEYDAFVMKFDVEVPATCTDPDAFSIGEYNIKNTAFDSTGGSVEDSCTIYYENPVGSGMWTTEYVYSCDNSDPLVTCQLAEGKCNVVNTVYAEFVPCANGCLDGACLGVAPTPDCPLSDMKGYWNLDGHGFDVSGNDNDGVIVGDPIATTGKVGTALDFDGIDDEVAVADSPEFKCDHPFTISAWVNPDSFGPEWNTIISKGVAYQGGYAIFTVPPGKSWPVGTVFFSPFDESHEWGLASTVALPTGTWSHVTAVYKGANVGTELYINGALDATHSLGHLLGCDSTSRDLSIGGEFYHPVPGVYKGWDGAIDEVEFFDRALDAAEISDIYNDGIAGADPCVVINPIADIGADIGLAVSGYDLDLDASGSFDSTGTIINYQLTCSTPLEPNTVIYSGASPTASVSSWNICGDTIGTEFTLTLTVTNDAGYTDTDSIPVKVKENPVAGGFAGTIVWEEDDLTGQFGGSISFSKGITSRPDVITTGAFIGLYVTPLITESSCVIQNADVSVTTNLVGDTATITGTSGTCDLGMFGDGFGEAQNIMSDADLKATIEMYYARAFAWMYMSPITYNINNLGTVDVYYANPAVKSDTIPANSFNLECVADPYVPGQITQTCTITDIEIVGTKVGIGLGATTGAEVTVGYNLDKQININDGVMYDVSLGTPDVDGFSDIISAEIIVQDADVNTAETFSSLSGPVAISIAPTSTFGQPVVPGCGVVLPVSGTYTLYSNLNCAGDGIIFGADNIVLNGGGYAIIGDGTGTAIEADGRNGITIQSLNIENWDTAASISSSDSVILENVGIHDVVTGLSLTDVTSATISGASEFMNVAGEAISAKSGTTLTIGNVLGPDMAFTNSVNVGAVAVSAFDIGTITLNRVYINNFLDGVNLINDQINSVVTLNEVVIDDVGFNAIDVEKLNAGSTLSVTANGVTASNVGGDAFRVALADSVAVTGLTCNSVDTCFNNDQSGVVTLSGTVVNGCTDTAIEVDYDTVTLNTVTVNDCPVAVFALAPSAASTLTVNNLVTDNVDVAVDAAGGIVDVNGGTIRVFESGISLTDVAGSSLTGLDISLDGDDLDGQFGCAVSVVNSGPVSLDGVSVSNLRSGVSLTDVASLTVTGASSFTNLVGEAVSAENVASVALNGLVVNGALTGVKLVNVDSFDVIGASSFANIAGETIDATNVGIMDIGDSVGPTIVFSGVDEGVIAVDAFDVGTLNVNNVNMNNFLNGIKVVSDQVNSVVTLNEVVIDDVGFNAIDVEKLNAGSTLSVTANGVTASNVGGDAFRVALADSVAVTGLTCNSVDTCFNNDQSGVVTLSGTVVNGCTDTAIEVDYDTVTLNTVTVNDCPVAVFALAPSAASTLTVNNLVTDNVDVAVDAAGGIVDVNGGTIRVFESGISLTDVAGSSLTGLDISLDGDDLDGQFGCAVSVVNSGPVSLDGVSVSNLRSGVSLTDVASLTVTGASSFTNLVGEAVSAENVASVTLDGVTVNGALNGLKLANVDSATISGTSSFANIAGEVIDAVNVGTLDIGDLADPVMTFGGVDTGMIVVDAYDVGTLNVNNVNMNNFLNGIKVVSDQVSSVVNLDSVVVDNVGFNAIDVEKLNSGSTLSFTANGFTASNVVGDALRVAAADTVTVTGITCNNVGECVNNDQSKVMTLITVDVNGCTDKAIDNDYDTVTISGIDVTDCPIAVFALAPDAASTLNVDNLITQNVEVGIMFDGGTVNVNGFTATSTPVLIDGAGGGDLNALNIDGDGLVDVEDLNSMAAQDISLAGSGIEDVITIVGTATVALSDVTIDNALIGVKLADVDSATINGISSFTNIFGEAVSFVNGGSLILGDPAGATVTFSNAALAGTAVNTFDVGIVDIDNVGLTNFMSGIRLVNDQVNNVVTLDGVTLNNVGFNGIDVEKLNGGRTLSVTANGIAATNVGGDALRVALAESVSVNGLNCNNVDTCYNNDQSESATLDNTLVDTFASKAIDVDYDTVTINGADIRNGPIAIFALAPSAASTLNVNNLVTQNVEIGIDAEGGVVNVNGDTISAVTTGISLVGVADGLITGVTFDDAATGLYVDATSIGVRVESSVFNTAISINDEDDTTGTGNTCVPGSTIGYGDDGLPANCDESPITMQYADVNHIDLHFIDPGKTHGICLELTGEDRGSCKVPIEGVFFKVFDRDVIGFNPGRLEWGAVYEDTLGFVSSCTTDADGDCTAYEEAAGNYVVIGKYVDEDGVTYVGSPKDPSDFVLDPADNLYKVYKQFQVIKKLVKNEDGTSTKKHKPGAKVKIEGSNLDIIFPDPWLADTYYEVIADAAPDGGVWENVEITLEPPEGFIATPNPVVLGTVANEVVWGESYIEEVGSDPSDPFVMMITTTEASDAGNAITGSIAGAGKGKKTTVYTVIEGHGKGAKEKAEDKAKDLKAKGKKVIMDGKEFKGKGKALGRANGPVFGTAITGGVIGFDGGVPSTGMTVLIVIVVLGLYVLIHKQKRRR